MAKDKKDRIFSKIFKARSDGMKRAWAKPKNRLIWLRAIKETNSDPKVRKLKSQKAKKYWSDPKNRKAQSKRMKNRKITWGKKLSRAGLKAWNDATKAKKILHGMHKATSIHPNSIEKIVDNLTPSNVKFVGDKQIFVTFKNGRYKNPDFIVQPFEETKKVIEVNGTFWHKDESRNYLRKEYKKIGVDCLTIWQEELEKDIDRVKKKVDKFI